MMNYKGTIMNRHVLEIDTSHDRRKRNTPVSRAANWVDLAVRSGMIYPQIRIIESAPGPVMHVDGKAVLNFSSNNYLGLSDHPRLKEAAVRAIGRYGVGSTGSRLLSGNVTIHEELETKMADFKRGEAAIVFSSGYATNVGIINAVLNIPKLSIIDYLSHNTFRRTDVVLSDALNHASIIDGCRMSRRECVVYHHNDMNDLEMKLKRYQRRGKLVVTDGVFSMDGDIAKLDEIVFLCRKYNAAVMVDEAHATGTLGRTGRGTTEHFGLTVGEDVDIVQGTCSKSIGAVGGYAVCSRELIKYLRVMGRSYMFSTAMPPAVSATILEALAVMDEEPWRMEKVQENAVYLRDGLKRLGFDTLTSETQIIPLLVGETDMTIRFSQRLFERGIYGPAVRWPAVDKKLGRVRFCVMATHTLEHLDSLLTACTDLGREFGII